MIVPWQLVAKKTGAVLRYISLTKDEVADMEQLKGLLSKRTKLVALHHVSNVLGLLLTFKLTGSTFFWSLEVHFLPPTGDNLHDSSVPL